jgi:hypothetical protein
MKLIQKRTNEIYSFDFDPKETILVQLDSTLKWVHFKELDTNVNFIIIETDDHELKTIPVSAVLESFKKNGVPIHWVLRESD